MISFLYCPRASSWNCTGTARRSGPVSFRRLAYLKPIVDLRLKLLREMRRLIYHILEFGGQVHLGGTDSGNFPNASEGSVDAPCCTAPARPYSSRAILDRFWSVSKSSFTFAIVPSGRHYAAVRVPVWMDTLLMPVLPLRSLSL